MARKRPPIPKHKVRTIIESEDFVATRNALQLSAKRWDEIFDGASFALATRPSYFPKVPGTTKLHSLRTASFSEDMPSFLIFFTFTADEVVLEELSYAFPEDIPGSPDED